MNRFCLQCGTKLKENAQFCSACGTKVHTVQQAVNVVPTHNQQTMNSTLQNTQVQKSQAGNVTGTYTTQVPGDRPKARRKGRKRRGRGLLAAIALMMAVVLTVYFVWWPAEPYVFVSREYEEVLSVEEILMASPFYYYDNGMTGEKADLIKPYINDRINDSLAAAETLYNKHDDVRKEMQDLFELAEMVRGEQTINENLFKMLVTYEAMLTLSVSARADYEQLEIGGYGHSYADAGSVSQKLYFMAASTAYLSNSLEMLAGMSAAMVDGQWLSDPVISKNSRAKLEKAFERSDVFDELLEMAVYVEVIEDNINLVNIAKLEVAEENIDVALAMAPDMLEHLDMLEDSDNELLTDGRIEDIVLGAEASAYNLLFAKELVDQQLQEAFDTNDMELTYIQEPSVFPSVYARDDSVLNKKVDVDKKLKKAAKPKKSMWDSIYESVSYGVNMGVEFGGAVVDVAQVVTGTAFEGLNAVGGSVITGGVMVYDRVVNGYDLDLYDMMGGIGDTLEESGNRILEGKGGSTVLKEALRTVEDGEQTVAYGLGLAGEVLADVAIAIDESGQGTKYTEEQKKNLRRIGKKAGSFIGGLAAGGFTGLAKGIFKAADPTASTEDVALGLFEITTSLFGSSAAVGKVSGAAQYTNKAYKGLKVAAKAKKVPMWDAMVHRLVSVTYKVRQDPRLLIKGPWEAAKALASKIKDTAKNNLDDAMKEISVDNEGSRMTLKNLMDFVVGAQADNAITDLYKYMTKTVDETPVPEKALINAGGKTASGQSKDQTLKDSDKSEDEENTDFSSTVTGNIYNGGDTGGKDNAPTDTTVVTETPATDTNTEVESEPEAEVDMGMVTIESSQVGSFLQSLFTSIADKNSTTVEKLIAGASVEEMTASWVYQLDNGGQTPAQFLGIYMGYTYSVDPDNYRAMKYKDVFEAYFGPIPDRAFTNPEAFINELTQH